MKREISAIFSGAVTAVAVLCLPVTAVAQSPELGFGQPSLVTDNEEALSLDEPVIIRTVSGTLDANDEFGESGKFEQLVVVNVSGGTTVMFDLTSVDYDTFLSINTADGNTLQNDDIDGEPKHSRLLVSFEESTEVEVTVTSYAAGQTGGFELVVSEVDPRIDIPLSAITRNVSIGESLEASLSATDDTRGGGEYYHLWSFEGEEGDPVRVSASSEEIDTFLIFQTPSGLFISNDDFQGGTDSVIHTVLPETGTYVVTSSSYGAADTGQYEFSIESVPMPRAERPETLGTMHGLFVGVSDYGDRMGGLEGTALDARRVAESLVGASTMRKSDAHIFLDSEATFGNVTAAFEQIAAGMGPEDTFVFFFSGHGDRVKRFGDAQPEDMDGHDETIELYDIEMFDDEFAELLDSIGGRSKLVMLDSCFSGGFSGDVVDSRDRIGVFASEEAQLSSTAGALGAGGYLSAFVVEGIQNGWADLNLDGAINLEEFRAYLSVRFQEEVHNPWLYSHIVTQELLDSNQRLTVNSGSVDPFDILFFLKE